MRGLMDGHREIIIERKIVAAIPRPTDIERLAFNGVLRHGDKLERNAHLRGIIEQRIAHDDAVHDRQGQIARIDSEPFADAQMHARFTATQLGIIRDVVMDERRRVKMLDRSSSRERPTMIAPTA